MPQQMSGADVATWRVDHRYTQIELAQALGLKGGATTISAWERGRNGTPPYLSLALERLAQIQAEAQLNFLNLEDPFEEAATIDEEEK